MFDHIFKMFNCVTSLENNWSPLPLPRTAVLFSRGNHLYLFQLFFWPGMYFHIPSLYASTAISYFSQFRHYTLSCNYGKQIYFSYGSLKLHSILLIVIILKSILSLANIILIYKYCTQLSHMVQCDYEKLEKLYNFPFHRINNSLVC